MPAYPGCGADLGCLQPARSDLYATQHRPRCSASPEAHGVPATPAGTGPLNRWELASCSITATNVPAAAVLRSRPGFRGLAASRTDSVSSMSAQYGARRWSGGQPCDFSPAPDAIARRAQDVAPRDQSSGTVGAHTPQLDGDPVAGGGRDGRHGWTDRALGAGHHTRTAKPMRVRLCRRRPGRTREQPVAGSSLKQTFTFSRGFLYKRPPR